MTCRFKCTTGESSARSYVDVNIELNRTGIMQTAVLRDGFRYAVSHNVCETEGYEIVHISVYLKNKLAITT